MPFTTKPPAPPSKLPADQQIVDLKTGRLTGEAYQQEVRLDEWRKSLVVYLAALAAAIP